METDSSKNSSRASPSHSNACVWVGRFPCNQDEAICEDFISSSFPKEALGVMEVLWIQQKLCDVEIEVVGCEVLHAHRIVLAAASPYFRAMFTSDLKESQLTRIPIQGVSCSAMAAILKFAYTGSVKVQETNVCQLLTAANMLQVNQITEACCTFLEKQLDPSNCIGIADFALQHGCTTLYQRANQFIDQHFPRVSRLQEYLDLPWQRLVCLLRRDELNVRSESEVFEAVLRWVHHDEESRRPQLESVLHAVRCHFLAPHFIQQKIEKCYLLSGHPQCCHYLYKVVQDLTVHKKYSCCHERIPKVPCVIYIAGGYLKQSLGQAECFNAADGTWTSLANLPVSRSGLSGTFLNGKFYVAGGRTLLPSRDVEEQQEDSDAVHAYDPITNSWKRCASMSVPRHRLGVGVLDGLLYAVGGSHRTQCLKSVERYDPEKDQWTQVSDMVTPRFGVGVSVVRRLLYAVGGCNDNQKLSSVEQYHPETNQWTLVSSMNTKRSGAGVVSLGRYIYVIGGHDGRTQLRSVERYDTDSDKWELVTPLNTPRSALSAAVLDGKVYALGGFDGRQYLSSVEVYDPEKNEWTFAPPMPCGKSGHASSVSRAPCIVHGIT